MPAKRTKLKISFKVFSADNYSRFASKFPFLKEGQIKAKLHQAWRKQCLTTEDNGRAGTPKIKTLRIETVALLGEGENNGADGPDRKCHSDSPLRTYLKDQYHKRKAQAPQTTSTVYESQSSQSSVTCSATSLDAKEGSKESFPNHARKTTELRGLFDQIHAEQLLIEPVEKYQEHNDRRLNNLSSFYSHRELKGTSQDLQQEKSSDTGTVSGMFKWRADRKRDNQQNKDENSEIRFLVSNEREGDSNFQSMFAGDEDIFA